MYKLVPIPGYLGYFVFFTGDEQGGKVWSSKSSKWLTTRFSKKTGYFTVHLRRDGRGNVINLHHVLLLAAAGPCPEGMEGRHLDGNKQNNNLSNLRWGTRLENSADCFVHGTRNCGKKLVYQQVQVVKQLLTTGMYSQDTIAKYFGVSQPVISNIKNGKHYTRMRPNGTFQGL